MDLGGGPPDLEKVLGYPMVGKLDFIAMQFIFS
jgi:hypothetical protein